MNEALHAIDTFAENMMALYVRALGRLAYIARQVEEGLGLPESQGDDDIAKEPT